MKRFYAAVPLHGTLGVSRTLPLFLILRACLWRRVKICSRANLREARLQNSVLRFAALSTADLEAADMSGADLMHAQLDHANLSAVNLSNARLDHAHLASATLTNANLRRARLRFTQCSVYRRSSGGRHVRRGSDACKIGSGRPQRCKFQQCSPGLCGFCGCQTFKGQFVRRMLATRQKSHTVTTQGKHGERASTILPPHLQGSVPWSLVLSPRIERYVPRALPRMIAGVDDAHLNSCNPQRTRTTPSVGEQQPSCLPRLWSSPRLYGSARPCWMANGDLSNRPPS